VPYIRRHTRQTLAAWRLGHAADEIEIVVCELVTNAVRATLSVRAAAPVALYLAVEHGRLYVLVWDASPQLPARRDHARDAESGRGLELVEALSEAWGACVQPGGKVTWARFVLEEDGEHE
jgi:anti-sigma regulatory factor (Ser/Thr protein kinase)